MLQIVNEGPAWDGMDAWTGRALSLVFGKYQSEPDGHTLYLLNVEREVEELFDLTSATICAQAVESWR